MEWSRVLLDGLLSQGIKLGLEEVPVNIYLKVGDILHFCFIEEEYSDLLLVSETTQNGTEEIRVINKNEISYIGIAYAQLTPAKKNDVMFH